MSIQRFDSEAVIVHSGWMSRSSAGHKGAVGPGALIGNMRDHWELRFFVLTDAGDLLYYNTEQEAAAKAPSSVFKCRGSKFMRNQTGVCLNSAVRDLFLRAPKGASLETKWAEVLEFACTEVVRLEVRTVPAGEHLQKLASENEALRKLVASLQSQASNAGSSSSTTTPPGGSAQPAGVALLATAGSPRRGKGRLLAPLSAMEAFAEAHGEPEDEATSWLCNIGAPKLLAASLAPLLEAGDLPFDGPLIEARIEMRLASSLVLVYG